MGSRSQRQNTVARSVSAVLAMLVVGCRPGVDYVLEIRNVDGPPVSIFIEGQRLTRIRCGDPPVFVTSGRFVPPPWRLAAFTEDGASFGSEGVGTGGFTRQVLLVRDVGLIAVPPIDPAAANFAPVRPGCPTALPFPPR